MDKPGCWLPPENKFCNSLFEVYHCKPSHGIEGINSLIPTSLLYRMNKSFTNPTYRNTCSVKKPKIPPCSNNFYKPQQQSEKRTGDNLKCVVNVKETPGVPHPQKQFGKTSQTHSEASLINIKNDVENAKIHQKLLKENRRITEELQAIKLELNQCDQLEKLLDNPSIDALENQLNCICDKFSNVKLLNQVLCTLQSKYNEIQRKIKPEDLNNLQPNEAIGIKQGMGDQDKSQSCQEIENNTLHVTARKLSRSLLELQECKNYKKLPKSLEDVVRGIKDLLDLINQNSLKENPQTTTNRGVDIGVQNSNKRVNTNVETEEIGVVKKINTLSIEQLNKENQIQNDAENDPLLQWAKQLNEVGVQSDETKVGINTETQTESTDTNTLPQKISGRKIVVDKDVKTEVTNKSGSSTLLPKLSGKLSEECIAQSEVDECLSSRTSSVSDFSVEPGERLSKQLIHSFNKSTIVPSKGSITPQTNIKYFITSDFCTATVVPQLIKSYLVLGKRDQPNIDVEVECKKLEDINLITTAASGDLSTEVIKYLGERDALQLELELSVSSTPTVSTSLQVPTAKSDETSANCPIEMETSSKISAMDVSKNKSDVKYLSVKKVSSAPSVDLPTENSILVEDTSSTGDCLSVIEEEPLLAQASTVDVNIQYKVEEQIIEAGSEASSSYLAVAESSSSSATTTQEMISKISSMELNNDTTAIEYKPVNQIVKVDSKTSYLPITSTVLSEEAFSSGYPSTASEDSSFITISITDTSKDEVSISETKSKSRGEVNNQTPLSYLPINTSLLSEETSASGYTLAATFEDTSGSTVTTTDSGRAEETNEVGTKTSEKQSNAIEDERLQLKFNKAADKQFQAESINIKCEDLELPTKNEITQVKTLVSKIEETMAKPKQIDLQLSEIASEILEHKAHVVETTKAAISTTKQCSTPFPINEKLNAKIGVALEQPTPVGGKVEMAEKNACESATEIQFMIADLQKAVKEKMNKANKEVLNVLHGTKENVVKTVEKIDMDVASVLAQTTKTFTRANKQVATKEEKEQIQPKQGLDEEQGTASQVDIEEELLQKDEVQTDMVKRDLLHLDELRPTDRFSSTGITSTGKSSEFICKDKRHQLCNKQCNIRSELSLSKGDLSPDECHKEKFLEKQEKKLSRSPNAEEREQDEMDEETCPINTATGEETEPSSSLTPEELITPLTSSSGSKQEKLTSSLVDITIDEEVTETPLISKEQLIADSTSVTKRNKEKGAAESIIKQEISELKETEDFTLRGSSIGSYAKISSPRRSRELRKYKSKDSEINEITKVDYKEEFEKRNLEQECERKMIQNQDTKINKNVMPGCQEEQKYEKLITENSFKDVCRQSIRDDQISSQKRSKSSSNKRDGRSSRRSFRRSSLKASEKIRQIKVEAVKRKSTSKSLELVSQLSDSLKIDVDVPIASKFAEIGCNCDKSHCKICSPEKMKQREEKLKAANLVQYQNECNCFPDCVCSICFPTINIKPSKNPAHNLKPQSTRKIQKHVEPSSSECLDCLCKLCVSGGSLGLTESAQQQECDCLLCKCNIRSFSDSGKCLCEQLCHKEKKFIQEPETSVMSDVLSITQAPTNTSFNTKLSIIELSESNTVLNPQTNTNERSHTIDCCCSKCILANSSEMGREMVHSQNCRCDNCLNNSTNINSLIKMEIEFKEQKAAIAKIQETIKQTGCACRIAATKAEDISSFERSIVALHTSSFHLTMSGLKLALSSLQTKCNKKDMMVATLAKQIKQTGNNEVFDDILQTLATTDRTKICNLLSLSSLNSENMLKCHRCSHPDYPNCLCATNTLQVNSSMKLEEVSPEHSDSNINESSIPQPAENEVKRVDSSTKYRKCKEKLSVKAPAVCSYTNKNSSSLPNVNEAKKAEAYTKYMNLKKMLCSETALTYSNLNRNKYSLRDELIKANSSTKYMKLEETAACGATNQTNSVLHPDANEVKKAESSTKYTKSEEAAYSKVPPEYVASNQKKSVFHPYANEEKKTESSTKFTKLEELVSSEVSAICAALNRKSSVLYPNTNVKKPNYSTIYTKFGKIRSSEVSLASSNANKNKSSIPHFNDKETKRTKSTKYANDGKVCLDSALHKNKCSTSHTKAIEGKKTDFPTKYTKVEKTLPEILNKSKSSVPRLYEKKVKVADHLTTYKNFEKNHYLVPSMSLDSSHNTVSTSHSKMNDMEKLLKHHKSGISRIPQKITNKSCQIAQLQQQLKEKTHSSQSKPRKNLDPSSNTRTKKTALVINLNCLGHGYDGVQLIPKPKERDVQRVKMQQFGDQRFTPIQESVQKQTTYGVCFPSTNYMSTKTDITRKSRIEQEASSFKEKIYYLKDALPQSLYTKHRFEKQPHFEAKCSLIPKKQSVLHSTQNCACSKDRKKSSENHKKTTCEKSKGTTKNENGSVMEKICSKHGRSIPHYKQLHHPIAKNKTCLEKKSQ